MFISYEKGKKTLSYQNVQQITHKAKITEFINVYLVRYLLNAKIVLPFALNHSGSIHRSIHNAYRGKKNRFICLKIKNNNKYL